MGPAYGPHAGEGLWHLSPDPTPSALHTSHVSFRAFGPSIIRLCPRMEKSKVGNPKWKRDVFDENVCT